MSSDLVHRFRGWVIGAIGIGALITFAGSVYAGLDEVGAALARFAWAWSIPVLLLTLVNYGLRFAKWHYLLRRLGVEMPLRTDAWNFTAGLAMVISPGKAGELLKPYVVRAVAGAPMARTIPALITERLTDGIAMLILAGIGVTTYAADKANYILIPAALTALGLVVLASETLTMAILRVLGRLPLLNRIAHKLEELTHAMRACVAPVPLVVTVLVSMVAWFAECLGYQLVFRGLGVDAPLGACAFLYAFATMAGGAMPGGLGVAEGALAAGAVTLMGVDKPTAVASMLLIRVATLWFGVGLGTIALFRISALLGGGIALEQERA